MTVAEAARAPSRPQHIVDVLIEERAPRLSQSWAWSFVRPLAYAVLRYDRARAMADAIAPLGGQAALDYISDLLSLNIEARGLEHIAQAGRCVIVANHPTGIADGIAVYDALKPLRPDVIFFANADAHRVCPRFGEALIPVEWVTAKRNVEKTKATLRAAHQAFADERAVMIFPAGRLARRFGAEIRDPPWEVSAVTLARKHKAPVIPIHVAGPYPFWFHTFDRFSKELRDITLFHELLNKAGKTYRLTVGQPIPPEALTGEAAEVTERLKRFTEKTLGADGGAAFGASP